MYFEKHRFKPARGIFTRFSLRLIAIGRLPAAQTVITVITYTMPLFSVVLLCPFSIRDNNYVPISGRRNLLSFPSSINRRLIPHITRVYFLRRAHRTHCVPFSENRVEASYGSIDFSFLQISSHNFLENLFFRVKNFFFETNRHDVYEYNYYEPMNVWNYFGLSFAQVAAL